MFGSSFKEQQRQRYCSTLQLGNIIKYKVRQPRSSIILGLVEEILNIYIEFSKQKSVQMTISSLLTVGELQQRIRAQFQVSCQYLSFQQKLLNENDKLSDCEIINGSILRVKHNFIVEIELTIKLFQTNFVIHQIRCDQTYEINKIKKEIGEKHKIETDQIRLFLGKKQIQNKSLADLGIYSNCTLLMKISKIVGIKNETMIEVRNHADMKIQNIQKDTQIKTFRPNNNDLVYKKYSTLQQKRVKNPIRLQLANGYKIQCTKGMYFYTPHGWTVCSDGQPNSLKIGDEIMLNSKQFMQVANIYYINDIYSVDITCLALLGHTNFSANQIMISPPLSIQILYNQKQIFGVEMHEEMTVLDLKRRIQSIKKIGIQSQYLYIQNKQKLLKDHLILSQIYNDNLIIQLSQTSNNWKSKIQEQKLITFHFYDQSKQFNYKQICKKTCQEIIRQFFKEKVELNPYFGVLLNLNIVKIDLKIQQVVNEYPQVFYYQTLQVLVIKFPEKFILKDLFKKFPLQQESQNFIVKSVLSSFSFFTGKETAKQRFTKNYQLKDIKQILLNLHKCNLDDQNRKQHFKYISQLINYLQIKPNFMQKCYRGVIQANPTKFQVNTVITVRQFLSCCTEKQLVQNILGQRNGIILHITSITGKQFTEEEIVFLPYTYFIVNKKTEINNVTHIHLLQMPSPLTFNKNLILWVDDQPYNNTQYTQSQRFNRKTTEMIPLTSTFMAKRWFHQFGWIVNRLHLEMRVISDMVRYQYRQGQKITNYQAGIDLIQYLFNDCGFTTPALIFCKDAEKGRQNLTRRGIRTDRFKQATNSIQTLYKYMNFSLSLSQLKKQQK